MPVGRAVERSNLGRSQAAAGIDLATEQDRLGGFVALPGLVEFILPVRLDAVDVADDAAVAPRVCLRAGLALVGEGAASRSVVDVGLAADTAQVDVSARQQHVEQRRDQADRAAAANDEAAAAYAATAGVVDLRRIQGGIGPEGHGHHLGLVVRGQSSDAAARSGRPAPEGRYRRVVAFLAAADGARWPCPNAQVPAREPRPRSR